MYNEIVVGDSFTFEKEERFRHLIRAELVPNNDGYLYYHSMNIMMLLDRNKMCSSGDFNKKIESLCWKIVIEEADLMDFKRHVVWNQNGSTYRITFFKKKKL